MSVLWLLVLCVLVRLCGCLFVYVIARSCVAECVVLFVCVVILCVCLHVCVCDCLLVCVWLYVCVVVCWLC